MEPKKTAAQKLADECGWSITRAKGYLNGKNFAILTGDPYPQYDEDKTRYDVGRGVVSATNLEWFDGFREGFDDHSKQREDMKLVFDELSHLRDDEIIEAIAGDIYFFTDRNGNKIDKCVEFIELCRRAYRRHKEGGIFSGAS